MLLPPLQALWLLSDQLCSKLLKAALLYWLEHYEPLNGAWPALVRAQLLTISPAQIDRMPKPARVRHPRQGLCTTQPGTLLRHQVPTRGGPPDTSVPGQVEADTVAHCGDTTAGDYVNSLTQPAHWRISEGAQSHGRPWHWHSKDVEGDAAKWISAARV